MVWILGTFAVEVTDIMMSLRKRRDNFYRNSDQLGGFWFKK